jgi:hypothetical protein
MSDRPEGADDRLTLQGMADCMAMVRQELIEAGVIDKSVPPMMVADAVVAHIARGDRQAAKVPTTPQEVMAFIGSHFDSMEEAADPENVRFQLSVHDLLSAFQFWFDLA